MIYHSIFTFIARGFYASLGIDLCAPEVEGQCMPMLPFGRTQLLLLMHLLSVDYHLFYAFPLVIIFNDVQRKRI